MRLFVVIGELIEWRFNHSRVNIELDWINGSVQQHRVPEHFKRLLQRTILLMMEEMDSYTVRNNWWIVLNWIHKIGSKISLFLVLWNNVNKYVESTLRESITLTIDSRRLKSGINH